MKKILTLILISFISFACSKEDPEPKNSPFLNTKWQTQDFAGELVWGGKRFWVMHFKSNTDFEMYSTKNGDIAEYEYEGKYTYDDKSVTLTYKDKDSKDKSNTYKLVNSGTLQCDWDSPYYCEYIKQQ